MIEMQVYRYAVSKDSDIFAPPWLAKRINYRSIKFLYKIIDGVSRLKGVRINDEVAEIGDIITFDGRKLGIERR